MSINELKSGLTILLDTKVYQVVEYQHVKPGKGSAFVRTKLRDLKNGGIQEVTFRGEQKIEEAFVEQRKLQYLYRSGDMFHFMDQSNFEEIAVSGDFLDDKVKFLKDNLEVLSSFYKNEILNIILPNFIEFEITHTEPGIRGDTARSGFKPAEIETHATVQVPLFIGIGDKIKIDTRTGDYIERVS
ncbi:MAG: elongation factor P [Candidatus Omnitrophica bacterium]|nr:elongation factor P [Candidatus Omnitrophota bacterium]MBU4473429.1 elongation factor P [Candidatus Omnitrophota bacterium]MCG2706236.1 elongation factor P [Candidatus Omnitrophota bacterium]